MAARYALISVSDKRGIEGLARAFTRRGIGLLSTGGSAGVLRALGLEVVDVATHTGSPEMMDGRVKTLHPRIHGGILARPGLDDDALNQHGIAPIDFVVVNLYPFQATVARPTCTLAEAIENIDIGGPSLLRAAAKNHARVCVLCDPDDYAQVVAVLDDAGEVPAPTRFALAAKAFAHTAGYDAAIASWLAPRAQDERFPARLTLSVRRAQKLRYGENPHQAAAFYVDDPAPAGTLATLEQTQGKELSYNNIADTDAALDCVRAFTRPACCIVKHANPCGVAEADTIESAYARAYETDPTSAFGGIIAFNRPLTAQAARLILERQFVEVIVAPIIEADAHGVLASKDNVRVLAVGAWPDAPLEQWEYKRVMGGVLLQDRDVAAQRLKVSDLKVVSARAPSTTELEDLLFAWRVVACVKSNAIVYARERRTIGIGAGQMSRVVSARIASMKAADEGLAVAGSVMASDAFFPFRDGIDAAAAAGIAAVIQPGGSVRDGEVIAAANEHGMAMVFTGERHFRH